MKKFQLKCGQCGYVTEDAGAVRCPRCNKVFLAPAGCDGACHKCRLAAEEVRPGETCPEKAGQSG